MGFYHSWWGVLGVVVAIAALFLFGVPPLWGPVSLVGLVIVLSGLGWFVWDTIVETRRRR